MLARRSGDSALLDINRSQLQKLFQRLRPNPEGRVSFPAVHLFFQRCCICPVRVPQHLLPTPEMQGIIAKIRPGPSNAVSLSYLQFEQMLLRIGRKIKGGLKRLLETIQRHGRKEFKVSFCLGAAKDSVNEADCEAQATQAVLCWSEESLLIDQQSTPRTSVPGAFLSATPHPTTSQISFSSITSPCFPRAKPKALRKLGSAMYSSFSQDFDLPASTHCIKIDEVAESQLDKVSHLISEFNARWHNITACKSRVSKPSLTHVRQVQEFAIRAKSDRFSQGFVKKLLFEVWRERAREGREKTARKGRDSSGL